MTAAADAFFEEASLAALYDALYLDAERADHEFYRPLAMAVGSVLDLGCGTGSFLRSLRAAGHEGRLVGIDPGPGMLGRARSIADIEWRLGDASAIGAGESFDLIVMTGHAFQVVVEDAAITDLLGRVRAALTTSGRFAFETRNPSVRAWESWTPDRPFRGRAPDGRTFAMTTKVEEVDDQRVTFRHDFIQDGGLMLGISRSTLRFVDAVKLDEWLAIARLDVAERYGDFDRTAYGVSSPEIVTIARPAA